MKKAIKLLIAILLIVATTEFFLTIINEIKEMIH